MLRPSFLKLRSYHGQESSIVELTAAYPGIDPFIESQAWETLLEALLTELMRSLTNGVRPKYIVRFERRVYIEHVSDERPGVIRPDIAILASQREPKARSSSAAAVAEPVIVEMVVPERLEVTYLMVREDKSLEVVTFIEILSPANKRPGSDGRREYPAKRDSVLESDAHFVELDLLRGGLRSPMQGSMPPADHYAIVSRSYRRPSAEVYHWTLHDRLPSIAVPLKRPDPDVIVDLQAAYLSAYDAAGFDYSLDRQAPLDPPLH
jgi:hypothetical protein